MNTDDFFDWAIARGFRPSVHQTQMDGGLWMASVDGQIGNLKTSAFKTGQTRQEAIAALMADLS